MVKIFMEMLLVLILFMLVIVLLARLKWKSKTTIIVISAVTAFLQIAFVVYIMLTMKLPWS